MDVTISDDQQAIIDLAARILGERLPPERLREVEAHPDWFARDVWIELARADLLGLCLPEHEGGGGYGMFEVALLLEQIGRALAPLPLLATLVLGAMPVAEFGTDGQRTEILPPVVAGEAILTAALLEPGDVMPPDMPSTSATREGDDWRIDGGKVLVSAAHLASRILVPASTGNGASAVFLVDPALDGVKLDRHVAINLEPMSTLHLDGVVVPRDAMLGGETDGRAIVDWITQRATAGLCAMQAGVCEAALRTTASYTSEREQFGMKIATFQAVAHRAADAYIDTEAVRLTAWQAAWQLAENRPADEALAIAKIWAADGAHRVVHAAQHLHGGMGFDVDYPVHRCFRWSKQLEFTLGGATQHLRRLGDLIAADDVG